MEGMLGESLNSADSRRGCEDAGQMGAPHEGFLYSRISSTAAATAAKVFRQHPHPEVARRYAEQLCDLVCWRLLRVS